MNLAICNFLKGFHWDVFSVALPGDLQFKAFHSYATIWVLLSWFWVKWNPSELCNNVSMYVIIIIHVIDVQIKNPTKMSFHKWMTYERNNSMNLALSEWRWVEGRKAIMPWIGVKRIDILSMCGLAAMNDICSWIEKVSLWHWTSLFIM